MSRLVTLAIPVFFSGALALGCGTQPGGASSVSSSRVFAPTAGDVVRVAGAATRCQVDREAGALRLVCGHTPRGRFSVVFYRDNIFVYRNGKPDTPVFSSRGRP